MNELENTNQYIDKEVLKSGQTKDLMVYVVNLPENAELMKNPIFEGMLRTLGQHHLLSQGDKPTD